MSSQPIVVEKVVNAPVSRVWKAITDKKQMKEWYFDIASFEPKVGFEFQFEGGNEGRVYIHLCKITEVVENKKLQHTWSFKGYGGASVVTWELTDMGGKTKVKLTHAGVETFPADVPDFAKKNFDAGWNEIVGKLLPKFVES
jgi:uncharacterized protein YndB with AHSA1/START domain